MSSSAMHDSGFEPEFAPTEQAKRRKRFRPKEIEQTLPEEIANSITHGVGVGLSISALAILVTYAEDPWRTVSFAIYGSTLILLYLASTFYHAFQSPRLKKLFNIFDHSAIFLLIAGTYTPFLLVMLRGAWGWSLFGVLWGFAVLGIIFKAVFIDKYRFLSVFFYLGMGWVGVVAVKPMLDAIPLGGLIWIAIGGLCYSLGVIFYLWRSLPFNHTIWHLFVLAGSITHFFGILLYVLPVEVSN